MAGIFGGHLFEGPGMGQATPSSTPDMTFSLTDPDVAAGQGLTVPGAGTKSGGQAYMPLVPSKGGSAQPAYMPPAPTPMSLPASYAPAPTSDHTTLYIVGGAAAVGLLAVLLMSGKRRGGTVAANRGKRGRRSRLRSR